MDPSAPTASSLQPPAGGAVRPSTPVGARSPLQRSATGATPASGPSWTPGARASADDASDPWGDHMKDAKRNLQQLDMLLAAHEKVLALLAKTSQAAIAAGRELNLLNRYTINSFSTHGLVGRCGKALSAHPPPTVPPLRPLCPPSAQFSLYLFFSFN